MGAEVLPASNVRGQWAEKISARWHKTQQGVIEVGRLLIEAKAQLGHGSFTAMIEANLPFGARTAQNLMKIAGDPRITNAKFTSLLPASWATLHEISQLDDSEFEAGINSGLIRPDMKQGEIRAANRQALKVADEARVMGLEPAAGKYRTLIVDPPYKCQRRSKNRPRGGVKVCRLGSVRSLSPKSTGGPRARCGLLLIGQRPWRAWEGPVGPRGQADAAGSA